MRHVGQVKSRYPTFGILVTDSGLDVFFLPTSVDRDPVSFKQLTPGMRIECVVFDHERGLRASFVRALPPLDAPSPSPSADDEVESHGSTAA